MSSKLILIISSYTVSKLVRFSGCLQLLEIYWNLKTLLEILEISWNLIGPPGNFCVTCRRSTALVSSHKTGYQIANLRNWSPYFIFATAPCNESYTGSECTVVMFNCQITVPYITQEAKARQTCPGFFLKSLLESPGNLLD